MTEAKGFGPFSIKSEALGEVEAVVATLNVVDRDSEIILPGAIVAGAVVKLSGYGHSAMFGEAPVGKGALFPQGDRVHFKGRFFMSTQRGAEAFATAKELGSDQEWSFGFTLLESRAPTATERARGAQKILTRLDPFEVSPVIRGAGLGTRTLSAKTLGASSDVAEEFARFQARAASFSAPGVPLPVHLLRFAAFAADRLGIPSDRMPQIRLAKEFDNVADERTLGTYSGAKHLIRVLDGRADLDIKRTLSHELAHAKEALDGREHSEEYAMTAAEDILAAWSRFTWGDL